MGRHQTKPWQRGYIPKPGHKRQNPAFTAPATPEGWVRHDRRDWNEYSVGMWGNSWQVIGRAGAKWRVYKHGEEKVTTATGWIGWEPVKTELFQSDSFDACVMFVKIELSNDDAPEPVRWDPAAPGGGKSQLFSQRYGQAIQGRAAGKISAGQMLTQMAAAGDMMKAYREAFPEFTQIFHDELVHDCRDPVQAGTAIHEALAALDFSELEAYCIADAEATRNAK